MRLTDSELQQIPELTVDDLEDTILDRFGFSRTELDVLESADKSWLLREVNIRLAAVGAKLRAELAAAMSAYLDGTPDPRGTLVTKEEVEVDCEKLRREKPLFWEQYAYIPASEAQRMYGRINQRDALREAYKVPILPEETMRVQDIRDFLPRDEAALYLRGTAKVTGTFLLLRNSDGDECGTAGQPPRRKDAEDEFE